MSCLGDLSAEYRNSATVRRLALACRWCWCELYVEALLKDRKNGEYQLAPHNAVAIDLFLTDKDKVQVKMVGAGGSGNSFAKIVRGKDTADYVIIMFHGTDELVMPMFIIPMAEYKDLAYVFPKAARGAPDEYQPSKKDTQFTWEVSASRIKKGLLNRYRVM